MILRKKGGRGKEEVVYKPKEETKPNNQR